MGTFLFYVCIFAGFFFLIILPLHKKYGNINDKRCGLPQNNKHDEGLFGNINLDPEYKDLPCNIWHRD